MEPTKNENAKVKELIKPRTIENVYGESKSAEALCTEYGAGTDCRFGNSSVDAEDDLLL